MRALLAVVGLSLLAVSGAGCGLSTATPLPSTVAFADPAPVDTIATARIEGTWDVTATLTAATGQTRPVGTKFTGLWLFEPLCPAGPCDNTVTVATDVGYLQTEVAYKGTTYSGTFDAVLPCQAGTAHLTGDLAFHPTGLLAARPGNAGHLAGQLHRTFVPDGPASSSGCTVDTMTLDLEGTPHR